MKKMTTRILLFFMICPLIGFAQEKIEFTADRPGVGTGTGIIKKGKIMWEAGISYDYAKQMGIAEKKFTFCNSLFRLGLTKNTELRLEMNGVNTSVNHVNTTGFAPISVGTKIKIYEGEQAIPSIAFMGSLVLPMGTKEFRPRNIAPSMLLLADHDVTEHLNLSYNTGLQWDGETANPVNFTSVGVAYKFNKDFGAYVETFDYFSTHSKAQWNIGVGANLMLSRRIQFDAAWVFNINHPKDSYGVSCGIAWLLN